MTTIKEKIIKESLYYLRRTGIKDTDLAFFIRCLHTLAPYLILIYVLRNYKTPNICLFFIVFSLVSLLFYYIFDGCIITSIEYKLDNKNYTIIDPYLDVLCIEKTNINRKQYTFLIGVLFFLILLFIYFLNK